MSTKIWVLFDNPATPNSKAISIPDNCVHVSDFIEEIKKKFPKTLSTFDAASISLHKTPDSERIPHRTTIPELLDQIDLTKDLIIKVAPAASSVIRNLENEDIFQLDGIDVNSTYLPRPRLIEAMVTNLRTRNFLIINSPAASGKSSLLKLFRHKMDSNWNCIPVSCLDHENYPTAFDLLKCIGIDLAVKSCSLKMTRDHIVMIDDGQSRYHETNFWASLIKSSQDWLPRNVKFVISATHMIAGGCESPVEFQSLTRLDRRDLLLNEDEYKNLMASKLGLPSYMTTELLEKTIWKECGGLIGAVRISIEAIKEKFGKDMHPPEHEVLSHYLSKEVTDRMARCFGSAHSKPVGKELKEYLERLYLSKLHDIQPALEDEGGKCFMSLNKAGVLVEDSGLFGFSSPMAKRYYFQWLFPRRCSKKPESLRLLIQKAVPLLSSSVLRNSASERSFPKEAVFQQLLMNALVECTPPTCSIYPALSEIIPDANIPQVGKIDGEIDFYLDGELRWGLELLVNGDRVGEHLHRFSAQGRYAPLRVNDYAVIDLRGGRVSTVQRHEKRITIFFADDFSRCSCLFGNEKTTISLQLAH